LDILIVFPGIYQNVTLVTFSQNEVLLFIAKHWCTFKSVFGRSLFCSPRLYFMLKD